MNYIVLDLEWDSGFHPKYKRFINQILQIGAVKLGEDLQVISSFEVCICSDFTKRVSGRFSRLTGITTQKMREGISLSDAVNMYNEWAGKDTVTMTAVYEANMYTVTVNGGTLVNGKTTDQVAYGEEVTVKYTGEKTFEGWYVGETKVSSEATYVFTMKGDVILTVKYPTFDVK